MCSSARRFSVLSLHYFAGEAFVFDSYEITYIDYLIKKKVHGKDVSWPHRLTSLVLTCPAHRTALPHELPPCVLHSCSPTGQTGTVGTFPRHCLLRGADGVRSWVCILSVLPLCLCACVCLCVRVRVVRVRVRFQREYLWAPWGGVARIDRAAVRSAGSGAASASQGAEVTLEVKYKDSRKLVFQTSTHRYAGRACVCV